MILLSELINLFEPALLQRYGNRLLPSHKRALSAMGQCRTDSSPMMLVHCPACETKVLLPHSCGHRSCPHCQHFGSSRPSMVFTAFRLLSIKANAGWNANSKSCYR